MLGFRALSGALAAFACAVAFAACGDDEAGSIPQAKANQWLGQLEEIEAAVDAGECDVAQAEAQALAADVSGESVTDLDPAVREALVSATDNLTELAQEDCEPETGATGETTTETTTTPPPAETTTPPIEEEPPPEEPEEEPVEEDDAPGGSNGQGQGQGQGGGQSGGIGSDG